MAGFPVQEQEPDETSFGYESISVEKVYTDFERLALYAGNIIGSKLTKTVDTNGYNIVVDARYISNIRVKTMAGNTYRKWVFVDDSYTIITEGVAYVPGNSLIEESLIVPAGATKLIVQVHSGNLLLEGYSINNIYVKYDNNRGIDIIYNGWKQEDGNYRIQKISIQNSGISRKYAVGAWADRLTLNYN